jgi:hypothetical protein
MQKIAFSKKSQVTRTKRSIKVFTTLVTNNNHMKIFLSFKHLGGKLSSSLVMVIHCSFCHPCSFLRSSAGLNGLLLASCYLAPVRARFLMVGFTRSIEGDGSPPAERRPSTRTNDIEISQSTDSTSSRVVVHEEKMTLCISVS